MLSPLSPSAPHKRNSWRTRQLARITACLERGRITIVTPGGGHIEHAAAHPGHEATVVLHSWRALRRLVTGGDIGFARAYLEGEWSSPDLTAFIALVADNILAFETVLDGFLPIRWAGRLRHLARANSRAGSRRNIAFHYDLGNDFYRLWLDDSMSYSAARAVPQGITLEAAQADKLERIVELLDIMPGQRVLEIGCGWGALACAIAARGAHVTGLTLSQEQAAFARKAAEEAGLSDSIDIRLQDYREVAGTFDRIVSIEMIEAVGEAYWPVYFDTLRARLTPGGKAVLQVITMGEDRFDSYRADTDFIQYFVFPGGMLPATSVIASEARRAGLSLHNAETFAEGYADTLAEWRRRFTARWDEIAALGFDERFRRLWHYYLCYCEAGFRTRTTDVALYVLQG